MFLVVYILVNCSCFVSCHFDLFYAGLCILSLFILKAGSWMVIFPENGSPVALPLQRRQEFTHVRFVECEMVSFFPTSVRNRLKIFGLRLRVCVCVTNSWYLASRGPYKDAFAAFCRSRQTLTSSSSKLNRFILGSVLVGKHEHNTFIFLSIYNQTHACFFTATSACYLLSGTSHVSYEMLDILKHMERTREALWKSRARGQSCTPTLTHEHTPTELKKKKQRREGDIFSMYACEDPVWRAVKHSR